MKNARNHGSQLTVMALTVIALTGCSSGSSGPALSAGAAELQGTWVEPCIPEASDNSSERFEIVISGNAITISDVSYLETQTCSSDVFIKANREATFTVTDTETELAGGNAKHVNFLYSGGTITASQNFLALVEAQGTTLQAVVNAQGITGDINNLSLDDLNLPQPESYTIYRLDALADGSTELRIGLETAAYDGLSPASRPIELDTDIRFTKTR